MQYEVSYIKIFQYFLLLGLSRVGVYNFVIQNNDNFRFFLYVGKYFTILALL